MAKRKKISKVSVKEAAAIAADESLNEMEQETFETPEQRDISFALSEEDTLSDEQLNERDVFPDGREVGNKRNKPINFRIYIDNEWVATKPGNYSWEKLRKDYPRGGSVKVVAVDRDNKYAASQTLQVAADEEAIDKNSNVNSGDGRQASLEMLELMKENQREAESKAQSQNSGMASIMASMMQASTQSQQLMMQMQAESTKLLMQQQQESNRQFQALLLQVMQKPTGADPMLTLVTTLLTKKPENDGFTMNSVLKMVQDAETRAENRANRVNELIEKRADALADLKAAGLETGDDSESEKGMSGLIKGFLPVLSQLMVNQQQAQPTQEQIMAMRIEEQRRLQAANPGLNNGFIEEPALRPGISGQRPNQRHQGQVVPPKVAPKAQPPAGATTQNVPLQVVKIPEVITPEVQKVMVNPQEVVIDPRLKEHVLDVCLTDIGNALLQQTPASKTAETMLVKLEKEGIARQTVAKLFTLEDFYGLAKKYDLPAEALPWIKEFYETIQKPEGQKLVGVTRNPNPAANGADGKATVAASGSKKTGVSPGAKSRGSVHNI